MSLTELNNFCSVVRTKIKEAIEIEYAKMFAKTSSMLVDEISIGKEPRLFLPYSEFTFDKKNSIWTNTRLYLDQRKRDIEKTKYSDPEVDISFSFTVHPLKNKIICILYTYNKELKSVWESMPEVKDYHYQNQTDYSSSISAKEWNQRKLDWTEALPDAFHSIPALSGMTIECHHSFYTQLVTVDNLLKCMPKFKDRVTKIVSTIMEDDFYKNKKLDKEKFKITKCLNIYDQYIAWLKTDEASVIKEKLKKSISLKLKKKITENDLMQTQEEMDKNG